MTFDKIHYHNTPLSRETVISGASPKYGRVVGKVSELDMALNPPFKREDLVALVDVWHPVPRWMNSWEAVS